MVGAVGVSGVAVVPVTVRHVGQIPAVVAESGANSQRFSETAKMTSTVSHAGQSEGIAEGRKR